jgi:hypothetical protein
MSGPSALRCCLAATAALSLGACGIGRDSRSICEAHSAYQESATIQPLRVPDGMIAPTDSGEMPVPSGPRAAVQNGPGGRCLESPPSYFASGQGALDEGLPLSREAQVAAQAPAAGPGSALITGASVLTNEVATILQQWAAVWSERDAEGYFAFYVSDFVPAGYTDNADWRATQRERFVIPARTEIVLDSLEVDTEDDRTARAKFVQRFGTAPNYRSVLKEMVLTEGGPYGWLIRSERILDVL